MGEDAVLEGEVVVGQWSVHIGGCFVGFGHDYGLYVFWSFGLFVYIDDC